MNWRPITIVFFAADAVLIALSIFFYLNMDRKAPVISFADEALVYEESMTEKDLLAGVTASDETDGDVTGNMLVEKVSETADGDVIVTYVAVDSSNNVAKKSRIYSQD